MQINPVNTDKKEASLIEMLLKKNILTADALQKMQTQAAYFKQTLFQYIMQYRLITAEKVLHACTEFFQLPMIALDHQTINNLALEKFPPRLIQHHLCLPIAKTEKQLIVAIANPDDIVIAKTLSFQLGLSIDLRFARYDTLCRLHNAAVSEQQYQALQNKSDQLPQLLTHQLLSDAIHRGASDIHFEPYQAHFRIRFRIDGMLHKIIHLPAHLIDAMTSCIKVLAQLDIAIKRMPQDGRLRFTTNLGFFKDCRVSTCPTLHGEKIVIRLLDANTQIKSIHELGLNTKNQTIILQTLQQPQGLILVTGPTGSGKTITLYTLLNLLNEHHRNITTIEDPIEMQIDGINQTHVNAKAGLTFSHTLRTLLRQDPDVIMIGEIRDQETAEMAIRAALTGHLVLATLHTNSAAEAITRLCHIGIAPFHLISALTLIIAQRLVRKLCIHCKTGCAHCTDGFQGRIGIFELMPINENIKSMILDHASHIVLEKQNQMDGQLNLWGSALEAVKQETTSLNEIYRAVPNHA